MARQWFYMESDGSECGPYSGAELRKLVQLGRVRRETLVRTDTSNGSIPAGEVNGLFPGPDDDLAAPTAPTRPGDRSGGRRYDEPRKRPMGDPIDEAGYRGYDRPTRPPSNNVFAVTSLISGILGWTVIPVVGAAVAIVTGHIALKQIERSGGCEDGKLMAVIGLILGYIEAVLLFVTAITLLFLGLSIAGLLGFLFQQAPRHLPRQGLDVPKVQRPGASAPWNPPARHLRDSETDLPPTCPAGARISSLSHEQDKQKTCHALEKSRFRIRK